MSRPDRRIVVSFVAVAVCSASTVRAQTIGDYSRAQRAWLESSMTQSAARSAGLAASAPASVASVPLSGPATLPALSHVTLSAGPSVQVSGVFESEAIAVAEIVVNATPYLVEAGQAVPGTPWRVDTIAADRVVLARRDAQSLADGPGSRKVFSLPAMR